MSNQRIAAHDAKRFASNLRDARCTHLASGFISTESHPVLKHPSILWGL